MLRIAFRPLDWPTWVRRLFLLLAPLSVPLWILSFPLLIVAAIAAPFLHDIAEMWEAKPQRRFRYAWYSDGGSFYLRIRRDSAARPLARPSPSADLEIRDKDMWNPMIIPEPASARFPSIAKAA